MQAEQLDDLIPAVAVDPGAAHDALGDARGVVDDAARRAAVVGGWTRAEPLRIAKKRLRWLLHCPLRALTDDTPAADVDRLAWGLVVDAAAKLLALGATRPVTVDAAAAFLEADGDTRVADHLAGLDEAARQEFRHEAAERLDRLASLWPDIGPEWWPRVEEPVRVPLADGTILLGGNLDVLLGGPPGERPGVVVEAKGGRLHDSVRADAHFYGLLLALRDDTPPAAVVTLAAGDGAVQVEPIRPDVLTHAADLVAGALGTAAELAAGVPPEARPGRHCLTCPRRTGCPAARHAGDDDPGDPGDPGDRDMRSEPAAALTGAVRS